MVKKTSTALSHPNIAFIKYWGNRDAVQRIPSNGSISMNLEQLWTKTTVSTDARLQKDQLRINGKKAHATAAERVSLFLETIRNMVHSDVFFSVESANNFPVSAGIASSASAFSALAAAVLDLLGISASEQQLSAFARLGSGSACRSIPTGFCEWKPGHDHSDSYAYSIASPDQWPLWDCIAVVADNPKKISSSHGHALAGTSPFQQARVEDAPRRLEICRNAIANQDFLQLAEIIESDSDMMHAVMMTSNPPIMYWLPASLEIMQLVRHWRESGTEAAYTLDAGPNIHVICTSSSRDFIEEKLRSHPNIKQVLSASVGSGTSILPSE